MDETYAAPAGQDFPFLDADALDALAEWAVHAATPLRVDLITDASELQQVQRLRHHTVAERGWGSASAEGLERDGDDASAVHVAAWNGADLVGTVRVVVPVERRLLPTERIFDIVLEPRGHVADWGRLVVASTYSGRRRTVMLALLGRAWLASRALGAVACVGVATSGVLELYRSLGVQATVLAGPQLHWGEQRYAARLLGVTTDAGRRMAAASETPTVPAAERP